MNKDRLDLLLAYANILDDAADMAAALGFVGASDDLLERSLNAYDTWSKHMEASSVGSNLVPTKRRPR